MKVPSGNTGLKEKSIGLNANMAPSSVLAGLPAEEQRSTAPVADIPRLDTSRPPRGLKPPLIDLLAPQHDGKPLVRANQKGSIEPTRL
jgi:hypothetical protein